jgi:hypothetical protein
MITLLVATLLHCDPSFEKTKEDAKSLASDIGGHAAQAAHYTGKKIGEGLDAITKKIEAFLSKKKYDKLLEEVGRAIADKNEAALQKIKKQIEQLETELQEAREKEREAHTIRYEEAEKTLTKLKELKDKCVIA